MGNLRDVYVVGVGMTPFGRHPDKNFTALGEDALRDALKDAGMEFDAIEVAFCGHVMQGSGAGQRVLKRVGKTGIPMMNVENACASGTTALRMAWTQVAAGIHDTALAIGFEKMARGPIQAPQTLGSEPQKEDKKEEKEKDKTPPLMPFLFSQVFNEHSRRYGTTPEQMAMVAVKNRAHAAMNPRSQHDDPITVEDVMNSREIAPPLRLLMCCPTGAGAAAAILCSEAVARTLSSKPIRILASTLQSEGETDQSDTLSGITEINTRTANLAYEMAGIKPDDVDAIELHDCFAIAEIIHYENLGLCERGEGGRFIEEGMSKIGGKVVVNPSGGLLSKGHPLGATGVAQVFEMVTQLRGDAGERQVPDARIGLTHCQGFGGAVGVHIFAKE